MAEYDIYSGKRPIKLCLNRVWRTYTGGRLLGEWKGLSEPCDSQYPEEWIASLVSVSNPDRKHIMNEGLSEFETEEGRRFLLKSLVEASPELFLGKEHVEAYGSNTGVLVKALDSNERLTIQVHPGKEIAEKFFGSEFGKTEAWYIIGGREIDGEPPYILFGFKSGITREKWEKMFREQDIQGMIDSMHKFNINPGQVFLIEAGIPHAIGSGCFLIEIQEPTDYTVRVERTTPAGLELSDFLLHQGLGFDRMFECFNYEGYSYESVKERWCKEPSEPGKTVDGAEIELISYNDTPCFRMTSIEAESKTVMENSKTFSNLVVIIGKGTLKWDDGEIDVAQGDELFLPVGVKNLVCSNATPGCKLLLVRCYPPVY